MTDTHPPSIYTLSLHDALPIYGPGLAPKGRRGVPEVRRSPTGICLANCAEWEFLVHVVIVLKGKPDRKSTRLNSSHLGISYAVFCLKQKTEHTVRKLETSDDT